MNHMKHFKIFVICMLCILGVFNAQVGIAKKGPKKIPPGQAKKQGLSKGKRLPPGQVKKQKIPSMELGEKAQQEWCLEHDGKVNVVLSDRTICGCLTETHAVVFASEDNWLESIGKSLHSAVLMEKQPGIALFMEKGEEKEITLKPEESYGEHNPQLMKKVPREHTSFITTAIYPVFTWMYEPQSALMSVSTPIRAK